MKVCFYGNTGHFFTAFLAGSRIPEVEFAGYCPSYSGESMERLLTFAGKSGTDYPDGWEIHARSNQKTGGHKLLAYQDLEMMLNAENPDILVIDGLFTQRYEHAKAALQRGIHVYVDKPIALTVEELTDLYKVMKQSGKLLWAMHTVRFDAWYHTARKIISQGALGNIRMVNCQKSYRFGVRPDFYKERKYYGGTIPWVTIHSIDMIRMVTGKEMLSVYSRQSRAHNHGYGDMEVITSSDFLLEDDILATVCTDYYRPENSHSHDDDRIRVVGTDGILEVIRGAGDHEVRLINKDFNGIVEQQETPFIFEDFVRTIQGKGANLMSINDSFRNAYVAICAQKSADKNKIIAMQNAKELFS